MDEHSANDKIRRAISDALQSLGLSESNAPDLEVLRKRLAIIDKLPSDLLLSVENFPVNDTDGLMWMALFHLHRVFLREPIAGVREIGPLSQRGAAMAIADSWADAEDERSTYMYWYRRYNLETPYESIADVPSKHLTRLRQLQDRLRLEPRVADVVPDLVERPPKSSSR